MSDHVPAVTPTDPAELRAEIVRTRAELGDTVEALAGRFDVKARAKDAAAQAVDDVKAKAAELRDQAVDAVAGLGVKMRSSALTVRDAAGDLEVRDTVRRPLPLAVVALAIVGIGVAIYLFGRRRP